MPRDGRVSVPAVVRTRLFGELRGVLSFPVERSGETAAVAWTPELRLPGLRAGERVRRRLLREPERASVLDAAGRRLGRERCRVAALAAGIEKQYDARLGGSRARSCATGGG